MSRAPSDESFYEGELVEITAPSDEAWTQIDQLGLCKTTTDQRDGVVAALTHFVDAYTRETRAATVPMVRTHLKNLQKATGKFSTALGEFMVNGDVQPGDRHARALAREYCETIDLERLHDETCRLFLLLAEAIDRTKGSAGREKSDALDDCVRTLRALYGAAGGRNPESSETNKTTGQWPFVVRWLERILQLVPTIGDAGVGVAPYHNAATLALYGRETTEPENTAPGTKRKKSELSSNKSGKGKPRKSRAKLSPMRGSQRIGSEKT